MKMKTSEVLELAKAEVESGWCKYKLFDDEGNVCAVGAVYKAYEEIHQLNSEWEGLTALNKTAEELGWGSEGLVRFNNHRDTTKEDVVAVFQKTICRLQERGK